MVAKWHPCQSLSSRTPCLCPDGGRTTLAEHVRAPLWENFKVPRLGARRDNASGTWGALPMLETPHRLEEPEPTQDAAVQIA